jgi:aldose 1-epimerase
MYNIEFPNCFHMLKRGGMMQTLFIQGFNSANWKAHVSADNSLTFSHLSPDGDEGYPGDVLATVSYALRKGDGSIEVTFRHNSKRVRN